MPGVLAGAILNQCPNARLVVITHEVPPFDIAEGSYLLACAAREFPPHVVFVAVVDPGVGTQRRSIVLRTRDGRLFVGPDNGLFTGVIRKHGLDRAWEITNEALLPPGALSATFHGHDIYGPVGGLLAGGLRPERVGPAIDDPILLSIREPSRSNTTLTGQVVHVDHYGNVVTNIPAAWLAERHTPGRDSVLVTADGTSCSAAYVRTYADVPRGALLILANSEGVLQIARNSASAAKQLGARAASEVTIDE